ncbi:MAG TPA: PDZ domain-containing protein [Gemmatimonadales bacterium]|nr:PDZ domain-containing protein [Gemmatimonadales bacterium]
MRTYGLVVLMAATVAAPATAQQGGTVTLKRMPTQDIQLSNTTPGTFQITVSGRGRIGVLVDMRPGPNDSIGATVQSVTPGGPAAKAGIQGGDIITRLKGTALVDRSAQRSASGDDSDAPRSQPGLKLLDLASGLSAGDTVAVEFRRGKERKTVQLVTSQADGLMTYSVSGDTGMPLFFRSAPGGAFRYGFKVPEPGDLPFSGNFSPDQMAPMMRDQVFLRVGSPLGDMEFAPMNPDLGHYFGVTDGILVLSVPDSSPLALKAGDVILTVGDRKPNTVSKLLGILQTYDDGEVVTLDVMRERKHVTVTGKANWSEPRWQGRMPFKVQGDQMRLQIQPDHRD